jgi:hypothetical protein
MHVGELEDQNRDGWNRSLPNDAKCERMERKGDGQEATATCHGSSQGPNWCILPLIVILRGNTSR